MKRNKWGNGSLLHFELQSAGIDFALRMSSEKKGRKGTEMIM